MSMDSLSKASAIAGNGSLGVRFPTGGACQSFKGSGISVNVKIFHFQLHELVVGGGFALCVSPGCFESSLKLGPEGFACVSDRVSGVIEFAGSGLVLRVDPVFNEGSPHVGEGSEYSVIRVRHHVVVSIELSEAVKFNEELSAF